SVPPAGPAWCRALAAAPHLTRVEELDFSSGWRPDGVFHDPAALEALGQATHLAGLRRLRLGAPPACGAPPAPGGAPPLPASAPGWGGCGWAGWRWPARGCARWPTAGPWAG